MILQKIKKARVLRKQIHRNRWHIDLQETILITIIAIIAAGLLLGAEQIAQRVLSVIF